MNMKKVIFVLPVMRGGGAERVAAQIANQMNSRGMEVTFVLTSDAAASVKRTDLSENIPLVLLRDPRPKESLLKRLCFKAYGKAASLMCKPYEILKKPVPAGLAKLSLSAEYHSEIGQMRKLLIEAPDAAVVSFLQPSIPIVLLAARKLPNSIIISERGDPRRLMKKRYGRRFVERYYSRADKIVFQTEDARSVYPDSVAQKGVIISNPIKPDLPQPYHGARNRCITTFCRISNQKNLPLLIDAFAAVHQKHPGYLLRIIGDALNDEGKQVLETIKTMIVGYGIRDAVRFEPFNAHVHKDIIRDAMYVNSSDYEGISNAMLEAMAIGMPVVCTDCPIGGAAATVTDGENGLLVPIQNPDALGNAINRVIEEDGLADIFSENAAKIRTLLSLETITEKWIELL